MEESERCGILKDLVEYNKESGAMYWLKREGASCGGRLFNGRFEGKEITTKQYQDYLRLKKQFESE